MWAFPFAAVLAAAPRPAPIRRVETDRPVVAITFDACATGRRAYSFDRGVYDVLRAERVPATVFVSGRWLEGHPGAARELAADRLVELGNHSYDHPHMTRLSRAKIARELARTEGAIEQVGRRAVAFRPPFGDWNRRVLRAVAEAGLSSVTWDVASGDPVARRAETIVARVVARARPGSIIVFHINGHVVHGGRRLPKTAEALPIILRELRAKGFEFVKLSELLALAHPSG